MKTSVHLLIAFGSLFGVLCITFVLIFIRYKFTKRRNGRTTAIDPVYETQLSEKGADGPVVVSGWGITPVAAVGPNGTRTFLNGWFGLDAPTGAGWKRFSDTEPTRVDENHDAPRESHFAQASRRSRRLRRENAGVDDLGMLETGSGDRQQVEDQDSDEFEEPEVWRDDTRRRGH